MSISSYLYEVDSSLYNTVITTGSGVTAVNGSPKWLDTSAIHGACGVFVPAASGGGQIIYVNPNSSGSSGSLYVRPVTIGGSASFINFKGAVSGSAGGIQMNTGGSQRFRIVDGAGTAIQTTVVAGWTASSVFRVDWKISYDGTNTTLTARFFTGANAEGYTPNEELTGTWASTSPASIQIGSGNSSNRYDFDTLRLASTLLWLDPFAPSFINTPGTYIYEEGSEGALATLAFDVIGSHGAPTYAAAAAIHGTLGIQSPTSGGGALTYANPNPANSTGSCYFNFHDMHSHTAMLVTFKTPGGENPLGIMARSAGTFAIVDNDETPILSSDLETDLDVPMRVDWQSIWDGTNMTLNVRLFVAENFEGRFANEEMTYTLVGASSPTNIAIGNSGTAEFSWDTLRLSALSDWMAPYNPPIYSVPGTADYTWLGDLSYNSITMVSRVKLCTTVNVIFSQSPALIGSSLVSEQFPDVNNSVRHTITDLQPNTKYYYQLMDTPLGTGLPSPIGDIGSFTTAPQPGKPSSFRVACSSCQSKADTLPYDDGEFESPAFPNVQAYAPLWFAHLGDFHYAGVESADPNRHLQAIERQIVGDPDHVDNIPFPGLKSFCENIPMFYNISDHEYSENNGDNCFAGYVQDKDTHVITLDPDHKTYYSTIANQIAFNKYVPADLSTNGDGGANGRYRSWVNGRVRFIMIDIRTTDRSAGFSANGPSKTMLGAKQLAWLFEMLLMPEPVKVILGDVQWSGPAPGEVDGIGSTISSPWVTDTAYYEKNATYWDKWVNYSHERDLISDFITTNNVQVEYWGGDGHFLGTDDGTNNLHGGFPVLACSPMYQHGQGHHKEYYGTCFDRTDPDTNGDTNRAQYMRIEFIDDGEHITRIATGWDSITDLPAASTDQLGAANGIVTLITVYNAPLANIDYKSNVLMRWNGSYVTDHNRSPLTASVERIENKQRMASGTLRKYVVAKKRTWSCSWDMLPHSNTSLGMPTVDGRMAGQDIKNFYDSTNGPFQLDIYYGDGTFETAFVMFSDFSHEIQKRGKVDFWNISVSMEEV